MSKRNSKVHDKVPPRKKIRFSVDISKDFTKSDNENDDCQLLDISDLTGVDRDEIENTIYEAIRKNNISTAKAKYLIRKMLKHPIVIEWFRNLFNSDNHQFNLLYEPPVTRSSRKKLQDDEDPVLSSLDANLIGRLLLSQPTIHSLDFENEDNNDNDYLPDSEYSNDSDQSSLVSDFGTDKTEPTITSSPYCTRSKVTLSDIEVNLLDDFQYEDDDIDIDEVLVDIDHPVQHEPLSLEEMHNLMDLDVDDQRYEEFKLSLRMSDDTNNPSNDNNNSNDLKHNPVEDDEIEDESDFDVLAELEDLEEEIFDEIRDDKSVKISRSELWGLLEDNKLIESTTGTAGPSSSITAKKSKPLLCEDHNDLAATFDEISSSSLSSSCLNVKEKLGKLKFSPEQRDRLSRQIIMFYQQLATTFVMVYDQPHLKSILDSQINYYYCMINNLPSDYLLSSSSTSNERNVFDPENRAVVEKILFNYRGISYIPTNRFNDSASIFRKIDFPKCVMATLLCSPAFPYVELLPGSFRLYNRNQTHHHFRQVPFLASEDKLLTLGIIQFSHQCHKMLKLIKKYLFPIRSTDQLRNRKTNIIRRQKELNHHQNRDSELFAELFFQSSIGGYCGSNAGRKSPYKVYSDLAALPRHCTPIWQRKDQWKSLPDNYKSFLTKTVPNVMYQLHLCTKDEWYRANRLATNRKTNVVNKEFQFCNWSSLPWELERTDVMVNQENRKGASGGGDGDFFSKIRGNGSCNEVPGDGYRDRVGVTGSLRKVLNKKSFPQYEVPKNSKLKEFLKKWNCNYEETKSEKIATPTATVINNHSEKQNKTGKFNHSNRFIFLRKSIKKARRFFLHWNAKRNQKKLKAEQSYAHYFRDNDNAANLFPSTAFKNRLDECITLKDGKSHRLQRFQNKCRDKEFDIIDFTSVSFSNQDEVDLIFSRNLLSSLRNNLNSVLYERCLDKINEFHSKENDTGFDESSMELMKYLMTISKSEVSNVNIYEDLLSLLTFRQAMKLGCEIDWCHVRKFWVRLSSLIHKSKDGAFSLAKVIQYLHASLKSNPFLQSQIAPLLNCWETPFPNYPQSFANFDALSSNQSAAEFCKDSDKDCFEYFSELAEQPRTSCTCSCHDNNNGNNNIVTSTTSSTTTSSLTTPIISSATNSNNNSNINIGSTAITFSSTSVPLPAVVPVISTANATVTVTNRHCTGCSLKLSNGSIYLDDSRFHKRLITINLPSGVKAASKEKRDSFNEDYVKITTSKPDVGNSQSMSIIEFLKSKGNGSSNNCNFKPFHNRCITIKETQTRSLESINGKGGGGAGADGPTNKVFPLLANSMQYSQVLIDNEAAMDADVFRQIKGQNYQLNVASKTDGVHGDDGCVVSDSACGLNEGRGDGCITLQIPTFESTVKSTEFSSVNTTLPSSSCVTLWTDDDNLLLLKLCQKHGPTSSTFLYLQGAHFSDRSLAQIEDQFNFLFQKVLEYQQQRL